MRINAPLPESRQSDAEEAPANADPVDPARTRSRRRRLAAVGAMVVGAVAVATVSALPTVLSGTADGPRQPAGSTPAPPYELPAFPVTPTREPDGLGEAHVVLSDSRLSLIYGDLTGDHNLTVDLSEERPDSVTYGLLAEADQEQTTVLGHDAALYTSEYDGLDTALVWQHRPDLWVTALGTGVASADLVWFAEGLTDQPFPVRPPFTFEQVPSGMVPVEISPESMAFGTPGVEDSGIGAVLITQEEWNAYLTDVTEIEEDPSELGQPVRVGDREGRDLERLYYDEDLGTYLGPRLLVDLDGGLLLMVTGDDSLSLDDLVAFAAGTEVTPDAVPMEG